VLPDWFGNVATTSVRNVAYEASRVRTVLPAVPIQMQERSKFERRIRPQHHPTISDASWSSARCIAGHTVSPAMQRHRQYFTKTMLSITITGWKRSCSCAVRCLSPKCRTMCRPRSDILLQMRTLFYWHLVWLIEATKHSTIETGAWLITGP
jgi:hypothetical protein